MRLEHDDSYCTQPYVAYSTGAQTLSNAAKYYGIISFPLYALSHVKPNLSNVL